MKKFLRYFVSFGVVALSRFKGLDLTKQILLVGVVGAICLFLFGGKAETSSHGGHDDHGDHEEHDEQSLSLSSDILKTMKMTIHKAHKKTLQRTLRLDGRIVPARGLINRMHPRFPGIIREVNVNLGSKIKRGDSLAILEGNENLAVTRISSSISGELIGKELVAGEFVREDGEILTIADLSKVQVNFYVHARNLGEPKVGQAIIISDDDGHLKQRTEIDYVSQVVERDTQTLLIRATVDNSTREWRPGLFVFGELVLEEFSSPIVIEREAVQELEGQKVIFVRKTERDDTYVPHIVKLGRQSRKHVEVLEGIDAGQYYISGDSFVAKAQLLKSLAGHSHD